MAGKKITELSSGSLSNLPLSGVTTIIYSGITHQHNLSHLRQILVDSGSHYFTGSQVINGNLTISGSITAQQYILSSSITNITTETVSGSSNFGNSLDDNHNFTGSLKISGSLLINETSFTAATSGTSGTSGSSGSSGSSGISGTSGTSGESGSSGTSGESGTSGSSGTSGESGSSGTSGESGSSGTSGESGSSGTSGTSGTSVVLNYIGLWSESSYIANTVAVSTVDGNTYISKQSTDGYQDPAVNTLNQWELFINAGTNGTSGSDGSSGTSGTSGESGTSGSDGSSGTSGSSGSSGISGVLSNTIDRIETITSSSYAALTPVSGTLYIIID